MDNLRVQLNILTDQVNKFCELQNNGNRCGGFNGGQYNIGYQGTNSFYAGNQFSDPYYHCPPPIFYDDYPPRSLYEQQEQWEFFQWQREQEEQQREQQEIAEFYAFMTDSNDRLEKLQMQLENIKMVQHAQFATEVEVEHEEVADVVDFEYNVDEDNVDEDNVDVRAKIQDLEPKQGVSLLNPILVDDDFDFDLHLLFATEPDVDNSELPDVDFNVLVEENTTHDACLTELVVLNECAHAVSLVEVGTKFESDDAIVEWVDMTQFFEKEKNASNFSVNVWSPLRIMIKIVPKLELSESLTSKEMTKFILAYEGVGGCYFVIS